MLIIDHQQIHESKQTISFYDTSTNNNIATLYQQAIAKGADVVIGRSTKENVQALLHLYDFNVPTWH